MTTEPEDDKKWEECLFREEKSQACVNTTGRNTLEISLLKRALCGGKLSWQVFDAEIITVGRTRLLLYLWEGDKAACQAK